MSQARWDGAMRRSLRRRAREFAREMLVPPGLWSLAQRLAHPWTPDSVVDPRRYWDGEAVPSLAWNVPIFAEAGLAASTLTVGQESRDAVVLDGPLDVALTAETAASCRIGFAIAESCEGAGVDGWLSPAIGPQRTGGRDVAPRGAGVAAPEGLHVGLHGQPVVGLAALTAGMWHDVRLEIPAGRSTLRLARRGEMPVMVSHPIVRPLVSVPGLPRAVILIILDSLTADVLGICGNPEARTEAIDAFFRRGLVYENAFSQSEWTYPSMYSLITGKTTFAHGYFERYTGAGLDERTRGTLAQELASRGYVNVCCSTAKVYHPAYNSHLGYQRFFYQRAGQGPSTERVTHQAIAHLDSHGDCRNFLLLDYIDTHAPWLYNSEVTDAALGPFRAVDAKRDQDRFIASRGPTKVDTIFTPEGVQSLQRRCLARLHEVDLSLGSLFGYLERTGLAQESVVLLLADHGDAFRRGRQPLLCDSRTHVAFLMGGGAVPQGRITAPISAAIDVLPTILHLVDRSVPSSEIQGRLLPPFGPEREWVISESAYEGRYQAAVRTREFVFHFTCPYDRTTRRVQLAQASMPRLFERAAEAQCLDVSARSPEVAAHLLDVLMQHLDGHREGALPERWLAPEAVPA